jgi:8-oxo-dGTP pyrophosphatase MutT (NUDIX family)
LEPVALSSVIRAMTRLRHFLDKAVRRPATAVNRARKRLRKASGKPRSGAHAIALTREGKVILVRLRYARGWRLPGGGRSADESVVEGALREVREEIGMIRHGHVRPLPDIDPALVLVADVSYAPHRWSWEIEQVIEADLDDLPAGMSQRAGRWLKAYRELG